MDKYTIVYTDAEAVEHTLAISASAKVETADEIKFLDQYGEDGYVFFKDDVISTTLVE